MEQKRIQVSEATIKSINSMLCGNTGIDISVLVEDIANGNGKNQELVKMNVALILNGHRADFPAKDKVRPDKYSKDPNRKEHLIFDSYSQINDVVTYRIQLKQDEFRIERMDAWIWEQLEDYHEPEPEAPISCVNEDTTFG